MTLAQIMRLALRQLDEDEEDISEYEDVFRVYANAGYRIAVNAFLKPRQERTLMTDETGTADFAGTDIMRVVGVRRGGQGILFDHLPGGSAIGTACPNAELTAVCEITYPPMNELTDEPKLPEHVHAALADFICYRHLSSGSLAKQSRAQHFQQLFSLEMQRLRPDGFGSVTRFKGLYAVTDMRYRG